MSDERTILLVYVTADPRCQPRAEIDEAVVAEYAEAMAGGAVFPPVETFEEQGTHWLADGFHRYYAARRAGLNRIAAVVTPGDVWDAIERSCAVNGAHGLRRSNADKRRSVEAMFAVMEHRREAWGDREVARRCGVSAPTVAAVKAIIYKSFTDAGAATTRLVERGGRTFEMDTSRIGERPAAVEWPASSAWEPPSAPLAPISAAVQEQLISFERALGRRLVVGETLADCGKRLALARGELGQLVTDLGAETIRRELGANVELARRWSDVASLAGEIQRFARDLVAVEVEAV